MDYNRLADTALRLLTKYGQSVTVTNITTGAYDPNTGTQSTTTSTSTPKGLLTQHRAQDVDGTMIMRGDKKLLLDASAAIKTDDTVTVNNTVYTVVGLNEIKPAATRVLWICNVRASG